MNDHFTQINEKLGVIDQKIEKLACYGRGDSPSLDGAIKLAEEIKGVLRKQGAQLRDWNTPKQVGEYLDGMTAEHVTTLLRKGDIKGKRVDSSRTDDKARWTVSREAVEEYERSKQKPKD